MSFPTVPLASVQHGCVGTSVGSDSMTYGVVNIPLVGTAVQPGVLSMAHGPVGYKLALWPAESLEVQQILFHYFVGYISMQSLNMFTSYFTPSDHVKRPDP